MHEFVNYRGVEIEVSGKYIPGEPSILTPDPYDSSQGFNAEIDDYTFRLQGEYVTDLLEEVAEDILDLAINQYEQELAG